MTDDSHITDEQRKARVTTPEAFDKRHLVEFCVSPTFVGEDDEYEFKLTCDFTKTVSADKVREVDKLPENTCQRCADSIHAAFLRGGDAL